MGPYVAPRVTDYSAREGRLEIQHPDRDGPLAMVHLRCTNCGYGRMRRGRGVLSEAEFWEPSNGRGFLHRCDLCGYPERVADLYPRPLWPWMPEAYQQEEQQ